MAERIQEELFNSLEHLPEKVDEIRNQAQTRKEKTFNPEYTRQVDMLVLYLKKEGVSFSDMDDMFMNACEKHEVTD